MMRFDPRLPDRELFADADAMSEALGRRVRIERIRYKPGTSIVAAVRDEEGRPLWVLTHADPAKVRNHERHALRAGARPEQIGAATSAGPAWADRELARGLAEAPAGTDPRRAPLRYNPLRRLVMRAGARVIKISAAEQSVAAAQHLAAHGAAVIAPRRVSARATMSPWWGEGDLAARPSADLARRAGHEIAAIHAAPIGALSLQRHSGAELAEGAARAIGALAPRLEGDALRIAESAGAAAGTGGVVVHGDLSPDQILVGSDEVRIIDLDRAAIGAPEQDLGSFLAAGGDAEFLSGYVEAGGRVDPRALGAWTAIAHLQKAVEPFRSAHADWASAAASAVDHAREAIS